MSKDCTRQLELQGVKIYVYLGDNCRENVIRCALDGGRIEHTDDGAPYAVDVDGQRCARYVSLSHTRNLCVLAISDTPVGIDVERLDRKPPHGFEDIWAWTDTEAYAKSLQRGLSMSDVRGGGIECNAIRRIILGQYALSVYKGNA